MFEFVYMILILYIYTYIYIYVYIFSAAKVLSGRIAYSVPPPAATASGPKPPEDGNDSDWNVCDEDFESEEEEERKSDFFFVRMLQTWQLM